MKTGGLVLCGGKSSRMGVSKALLPVGSELMLQRVVRILATVVQPVAVVAAREQVLPELPAEAIVARDHREHRGPLAGLQAGLAALQNQVDVVFATSCDVPLLAPAFVRRMLELLGAHEIVVPVQDQFHHPLAAVYRITVLPQVEALLDEDRLRPVFLFDRVPTRRVPVDQLRDVDPQLQTLTNLNRPEDYQAALEALQLPLAPEIAKALGL